MTAQFADTSYFLALLIPNDENHAKAVALANQLRAPLVTTDWVIVEVGNHLSPQKSRVIFARFLQLLQADARMQVVECSRELLQKGLRLFQARSDKGWSVTDCISFVLMAQRGILEALSFDHHFEQAGFVRLPREA